MGERNSSREGGLWSWWIKLSPLHFRLPWSLEHLCNWYKLSERECLRLFPLLIAIMYIRKMYIYYFYAEEDKFNPCNFKLNVSKEYASERKSMTKGLNFLKITFFFRLLLEASGKLHNLSFPLRQLFYALVCIEGKFFRWVI